MSSKRTPNRRLLVEKECNLRRHGHNDQVKYRLKHLVEYGGLKLLVGLFNVLPYRLALGVAAGFAALSYPLMHKRIREARRRMAEVLGPDVPARQLRRWAWISWRNIILNTVEVARAPRLTREKALRLIDVGRADRLLELNREQGGFILAVCHMGNWDLAAFAVRLLGLPIFVLLRGQSNPLVTRYLDQTRERLKVGFVERHRALTSIAKRIKAGEVFTILPDIRAKSREAAIEIPFLGKEAYLMGGMGMFARLSGKPIVTAIVTRRGWGRHQWEIQDPIYPDATLERDEDVLRMTTEAMARFDRAIRSHPDQYFWFNKRWVLDDRF